MRLIDADRLLKAFCGHCEDYENCKTTCFDFRIIQTQPTVDAVPVVRCKDCKHCFVDGDNVRFNVCELNHNRVQADDWFCADGERKGGADDADS